jgi:hypothetical protein
METAGILRRFFYTAAACAACAVFASAQDKTPQPVEQVALPPHDRVYKSLTEDLATPLRFSKNQRTHIENALYSKVDTAIEQDKDEYMARVELAKGIKTELEELRFKIFMLKSDLPAEIREILDPVQKERFDKMVYEGYLNPVQLQVSDDGYTREVKEITVIGPDGKPMKKRVIVRKKKKASDAATQDNKSSAASAAPTVEEAPVAAYP